MFNRKKLQVEFKKNIIEDLILDAQTSKNDHEQGGVLMGELYPKKDLIVVTHVVKSVPQFSNPYNFEMDVDSIQLQISEIWKNSGGSITYLGDWHTHPEHSPTPSFTDRVTFTKNYLNSSFDQNFLLYIIVGMLSHEDTKLWIGLCNGFVTRKLSSDQITIKKTEC